MDAPATPMTVPGFVPADPVRHREALLELNVEYMNWNSSELERAFGVSLAGVVGMPVADYVGSMIDQVCGETPPRGCFYLLRQGDAIAGMGGLRCVEPGVAEIKRLYVRPAFRGLGLGERLLRRLLDDAKAHGYRTVRLDSGPFMHAAHRLYRAAGFVDRPPYPQAEVPAVLHAGWRFMERVD